MTGWDLQVELALTASRKCHFSLHFGTNKNETVCAARLFKAGTFNHSVTYPELSIRGLAQSPSELTRPDRGFSQNDPCLRVQGLAKRVTGVAGLHAQILRGQISGGPLF
jgi:hypothetical protein